MGQNADILILSVQLALVVVSVSGLFAVWALRRLWGVQRYWTSVLVLTMCWLIGGPLALRAISRSIHVGHDVAIELMHSPLMTVPLWHLYLANSAAVAMVIWLLVSIGRRHAA